MKLFTHWKSGAGLHIARAVAYFAEDRKAIFLLLALMSLATLAKCLQADGDFEAAVESAFAAVGIYQGLAESEPRPIASKFAGALRNLRVLLRAAGRTDEALELIDTALATYADPEGTHADALYPVTAEMLVGRAMCLSELGRPDAAVEPARKAVEVARRLPTGHLQPGASELIDKLQTAVEYAVREGGIDHQQAGRFVEFYEEALNGYTYLEGPGE